MKVSVVVSTYTLDRYDWFAEAVESVLDQTYGPVEVVLVLDGEDVYERAHDDFADAADHYENVADVIVHCNEENKGISFARTQGAELATGDVVAYIDDDGVARPDWIEKLVEVYEATDAVAVGGDVRPNWLGGRPSWFPEEFYWLVGCVEPGFADHLEEVRNTYGSNVSYRREEFLDVGGYDPNTGHKGGSQIQAHEAPAGIRLLREYDKGVVYTDEAVVDHTLEEFRGDFWWLLDRSFWQGYSKWVMGLLYPDAPDDKADYLQWLVTERLPGRVKGLFTSPSKAAVTQLLTILAFTAAVGVGYVYAMVHPDPLGRRD